jgi:hypothetical protein
VGGEPLPASLARYAASGCHSACSESGPTERQIGIREAEAYKPGARDREIRSLEFEGRV